MRQHAHEQRGAVRGVGRPRARHLQQRLRARPADLQRPMHVTSRLRVRRIDVRLENGQLDRGTLLSLG